MKYFIIFHLVSISFLLGLNAQTSNEVLLTVGDETVSRFEFEQIYLKNNQMVSDADKKSLAEYLDLYIIYKLKVAEAKSQDLHTTDAFKQELASYRMQLIQPHLVDKKTEDIIIRDAYERMKYEINASHILISVPENATPEDTLAIFKKISSIRDRIIAGEPFETVARATSDDPSVKRNGGNLGYFTAFQMVYPFESAAYNTQVGNLSLPVRSRFGYHIVKVNDKRISLGQRKASHIMIATPQNFSEQQRIDAKEKIDSIYQLVLNNVDFAKLARDFSQDPGSAKNGGELPIFSKGQMLPELENTVFELEQPGQISKPVHSQFGWHIIKLLEKKIVGSFDEMLPDIKTRISRDDRGRIGKNSYINELKRKYEFHVDTNSLNLLTGLLDTSLFKGNWQLPSNYKSKYLFKFAKINHTLDELATKISANYNRFGSIPFKAIVIRMFDDLANETILSFEENRIISSNPDIFYLLKEYHDGILLFEIMDKQVWTKATHDTEGIETYYNQNIPKYRWDERIHTKMYTVNNLKIAKKIEKYARSSSPQKLDDAFFYKKFSTKSDTLVKIDNPIYLPDNSMISGYQTWTNGISEIKTSNGVFSFIRILQVVKNEPKPLNEVRGQVIADYQEQIEKEWVEQLRAKYPVSINQQVFNSIISNFN
jgi:peptidyl-prolyl cis-trans isomerase SurA